MGGFNRPWYGGLPRDAEIFTFQGSSRSDVEDVLALADTGHLVIDTEQFALADVAEAYGRAPPGWPARPRGRGPGELSPGSVHARETHR